MDLLLGITGSIASYKTYDLCRALIKNQHKVRVILSKGALNFLKPELFSYLGVQKVYRPQDDFQHASVLHIDLARWCEKMIIAPASANTLSQLSQGKAHDLLSSCFLSNVTAPCLIFPAMNTTMYQHPFTQQNLAKLESLPHCFIYPPDSGLLACGEEGQGKLPSPETLQEVIEAYPASFPQSPRKILITAGATRSPLDPVRYLTNPSSGKQGFELAKVFLQKGHQVNVVAGMSAASLFIPFEAFPHFQLTQVQTTEEMLAACQKPFEQTDIFIAAAAPCDLTFTESAEKLKKEKFSKLETQKAPDVLATLLKSRRSHQKIIGFAAETQAGFSAFHEKYQRKPVDLLIGNYVHQGSSSQAKQGFGEQGNTYFFFQKGELTKQQELTKAELAHQLACWALEV